ncbi:MAG: hypothetical protein M3R17_19505 [Bacteroidota bacterium]|nr:hypothetical protein [Bacteroidota bacterium]
MKSIDSLGNFLYPKFNKGFFRFRYNQDTLVITDGNGPPFSYTRKYATCTFSINITPERKIKSIEKNQKFVKQKGNTIIITKSRNDFLREGKDVRVVVVFEGE